MFLAIFYLHSSIVKNIFDCSLSSVFKQQAGISSEAGGLNIGLSLYLLSHIPSVYKQGRTAHMCRLV